MSNFSLKDGIKVNPEETRKMLEVVKDVKEGKQGALKKLSKFVDNGMITDEEYEKLRKEYTYIYKPKKDRHDKKRSKKIKKTLWGIGAFWILLESFLLTWGYVINRYEKTGGFWYLFLYIFAIYFILDSNSEEVSELKYEHERLKEELEHYKSNERDVAHGNQEEKENETP